LGLALDANASTGRGFAACSIKPLPAGRRQSESAPITILCSASIGGSPTCGSSRSRNQIGAARANVTSLRRAPDRNESPRIPVPHAFLEFARSSLKTRNLQGLFSNSPPQVKSLLRTAFVLAGGGRLGAPQVGMLAEILEAGERPDLIVGASAGAINSAFLAQQRLARDDHVERAAPAPCSSGRESASNGANCAIAAADAEHSGSFSDDQFISQDLGATNFGVPGQ
jgi:hypothetical protein